MYQSIVLGLGFLLVIGGGYLITNVDKEGVVSGALEPTVIIATSTTQSNSTPTASGKYLCDPEHGCADPRSLVLTDDAKAELLTIYANGGETLDEHGSWSMDEKGEITIRIEGNAQSNTPPSTIMLKLVSLRTIITIPGSTYKEWGQATFRKEVETED